MSNRGPTSDLLTTLGDTDMATKSYLVVWKIDIEAENPEEAATQALITQRDPESVATVFEVDDREGNVTHVDVLEEQYQE